ncbi:MAG: hypothetical protein AB7F64_06325 [Gammaproteobacteria bacterium]
MRSIKIKIPGSENGISVITFQEKLDSLEDIASLIRSYKMEFNYDQDVHRHVPLAFERNHYYPSKHHPLRLVYHGDLV